MKTLLIHESTAPEALHNFFAGCVNYWNRKGEDTIVGNISGVIGNKVTQEDAKILSYEDFILNCIHSDAKSICIKSQFGEAGTYNCGKSGSHVWIHNQAGKRIMMIGF